MHFDVGSVHEIINIQFYSSRILACKLKHFPFFLLTYASIAKSLNEFL